MISNNKYKMFLFILVLFIGISMFIGKEKAFAGTISIPSGIPTGTDSPGAYLQAYDDNTAFSNKWVNGSSPCYASQNPEDPGIVRWISPSGNSAVDAELPPGISEPYGFNGTMRMDLNYMIMFCKHSYNYPSEAIDNANPPSLSPTDPPQDGSLSNNDLDGMYDYITGVSTTSSSSNSAIVTGLNNQYSNISVLANDNTRYFDDQVGFNVGFAQPLTQTTTFTIKVSTVGVAEWHKSYYCGSKSIFLGYASSMTYQQAIAKALTIPVSRQCPGAQLTFIITVQVQPEAPVGNIDSWTCTDLKGWTFDPNDPSRSLNVYVYVNGPAGSGAPGRRYLANVYRADVDAAYNITGDHGFKIDPSTDSFLQTYVSSGNSFTVYVYAIGVNSFGQTDGNNPLIGQKTIGPCSSTNNPPHHSPTNNPPRSPTHKPSTIPKGCIHPSFLHGDWVDGIILPPDEPSGYSDSAPPKASSTSVKKYNYATPYKWKVTGGRDQYNLPTTISSKNQWSPSGWSFTDSFDVSYANFINEYPYDDHNITLSYTIKYQETTYTKVSSRGKCYTTSSNLKICPLIYSYKAGTSTYTDVNATDSSIPVLPELCPRSFTILPYTTTPTTTPPQNTEVNSINLSGGTTSDSPTQATVQTQTTIKFFLIFGDDLLRHPMKIKGLVYNGKYSIAEASGPPLKYVVPPSNVNVTFPNIIDTKGGPTPYGYKQNNTQVTSSFYPVSPVSFSVPTLSVGDEVCAKFTDTPGVGEVNESGTIVYSGPSQDSQPIPTPASPYTNSDPWLSPCSSPVSNDPYTRIYGNDVISGIQFSGSSLSCDISNTGIIGGDNSGVGVQAVGSGSQFAAMSLGQISNFASAFLRTIIPTSTDGLTFANTIDGTFGGNFNDSSSDCPVVFNYYANMPKTTFQPIIKKTYSNGQIYDINTNTNDTTEITIQKGAMTNNYLKLEAPNGIQHTHVIYVNGNVYINQNIDYGPGQFSVSQGKVTNAPALYVIAKGNIYIGPDVTNLDGVYVAENAGDVSSSYSGQLYNPAHGGLINTCSDIGAVGVGGGNYAGAFPHSSSSYTSGNGLFSKCDNQLVVRGALIAHQVKLERTYASIRNSTKGENPFYPVNAVNPIYLSPLSRCSLGNGSYLGNSTDTNECSAQVFNFNPENYLGNPNLGFSQKNNYDSILSLPPVF